MELNLSTLRAEAGAPASYETNEVSRFKEVTPESRVIADSQEFIVYSLKNGANLRIVGKSDKSQSSFKEHKSTVRFAAFVTNKSNVVASFSDTELLVWYVDGKAKEPVVYFEAQFVVTACAWLLQPNSKYPDLLCVRDNKVLLLKASELISQFVPEAEGKLQATEAHFTPISEKATEGGSALLSVGSGGSFAYTVDPATVVTCTMRNLKTPPWKPCGKGPITHLAVMAASPILAAASDSTLNIFDIAAEPTPLFKIALGGDKIVGLRTSGTNVAAFLESGEVVLVTLDRSSGVSAARFYKLEAPVRGNGFAIVGWKLGSSIATAAVVDFGEKLAYCVFDPNAKVAALGPAAPQYRPQPVPQQLPPMVAAAAAAAIPPPQYGMAPPLFSSPMSPVMLGAAAPPPSPLSAANNIIYNPALAGVNAEGQLAAALEMYNKELLAAKERLDSVLSNATQVVKLIPQQVSRDATQLTALALEAQAAEIAKAGGGAAAGSSSADAARAADQVVTMMMERISDSIVDGVSDAIDQAIVAQLEPALRNAFVKRAKQGQRDAIKKRIDDVLKGAATEFVAELEKRQEAHSESLKQRIKEMNREQQQAMGEIVKYVKTLEEQLSSIERSGLLDDVKELRAEVARLKRGEAANAPGAGVAAIPPETIVSTARGMIASGDSERGLLYALNLKNADVTLALLTSLDEETRDHLFSDPAVSDATLSLAVGQLLQISRAEAIEPTVMLLNNMVLDRMTLTASEPLVDATMRYLQSVKPSLTPATLRAARSLETALRRPKQ